MDLLLEVRNLETWYGPIAAMQGVNLQVEKGQMVAVLGANGAGKTTLLNTLAGVIDPFKGQVLFNDQAIHGLDADKVCRHGLVLVPEARQRIFQWFPRLKEREQQHAGLLSGGEQQMLAIGRAYMAQPKLLMLDEPSLGLSPLLTKEIFNIISRIRQETGTSVLVVEQNAAIALAHADFGYIMELGRIVAADTCEALSQKSDVKEAYLGGHVAQGLSGTSQRWKRRKTWR